MPGHWQRTSEIWRLPNGLKLDPSTLRWQRDLSISCTRVGSLHAADGRLAEAVALLQRALAVDVRLAAESPDDADLQRDLAGSHYSLARLANDLGDTALQDAQLDACLAVLDSMEARRMTLDSRFAELHAALRHRARESATSSGDSGSGDVQSEDLESEDGASEGRLRRLVKRSDVADLWIREGRPEEAVEVLNKRLVLAAMMEALGGGSPLGKLHLVEIGQKLGDVHLAMGNPERAETAYRDALAAAQALSHAEPRNVEKLKVLAVCDAKMGHVRLAQGDAAAALETYERVLARLRELSDEHPQEQDLQREVSEIHRKMGEAHAAQEDFDAAERSHEHALAISESAATDDPNNADLLHDVAKSYEGLGDVRRARDDSVGALAAYSRQMGILRRLADDVGDAGWLGELGDCLNAMGHLFEETGNIERAEQALDHDVQLSDVLVEATPDSAHRQWRLWVAYCERAELADGHHSAEQARVWWQKAHDQWVRMIEAGVVVDDEDEEAARAVRGKLGLD